MALKAEVEKLEDVAQQYRDQYKKIDLPEGAAVYRLDVEKVNGLELQDASGLIASLEKERQNARKLAKYGTITPEEASAAVVRVAELTEQIEGLKKGGAKLGENERQAIQTELKRVHTEELAKEQARSAARLAEVVRLRKDVVSDAELESAGFKSSKKLMKRVLMDELDVIEEEKAGKFEYRTVVKGLNPSGEPIPERLIADRETTRPMSPRDRAMELAQDKEFKRYLDAEVTKPAAPTAPRQGAIVPTPSQPGTYDPNEKLRAALAQSRPVPAQ